MLDLLIGEPLVRCGGTATTREVVSVKGQGVFRSVIDIAVIPLELLLAVGALPTKVSIGVQGQFDRNLPGLGHRVYEDVLAEEGSVFQPSGNS